MHSMELPVYGAVQQGRMHQLKGGGKVLDLRHGLIAQAVNPWLPFNFLAMYAKSIKGYFTTVLEAWNIINIYIAFLSFNIE